MKFIDIIQAFEAGLALPNDWSFGVGDKGVKVTLLDLSVPNTQIGTGHVQIDYTYAADYEQVISVVQQSIKVFEPAGITLGGYTLTETDAVARTIRVVYEITTGSIFV